MILYLIIMDLPNPNLPNPTRTLRETYNDIIHILLQIYPIQIFPIRPRTLRETYNDIIPIFLKDIPNPNPFPLIRSSQMLNPSDRFRFKFAAVNLKGNCVAVAGKNGLAHYTINSRKWKLFGNETQVYTRLPPEVQTKSDYSVVNCGLLQNNNVG